MPANMSTVLSISWHLSIRATPPSNKEMSLGVVGNPCLVQGMERVVEVSDEKTDMKRNVEMRLDRLGLAIGLFN